MIPVHELLNRVRWDPAFARGNFEVGYHDRLANQVIRVPLKAVSFPAVAARVFQLVDAEGRMQRIPFHRVREVCKDGRLIWQRPQPAAAATQAKPHRARNQTRSRQLCPRSAG